MNVRLFSSLTFALALLAGPALAADLEVGASAPEFKSLEGVDGKKLSLDDFKAAKVLVVCFHCNECPVASDYQDRYIEFVQKYGSQGVAFVAVNCDIVETDFENLTKMKQRAEEKKYNFPYLIDLTGKLADAYVAKATPHLFVFDAERKLQYSGAFDDKQKREKVTKNYVADAVDALLAGKTPPVAKTKAFGCGIRNKPDEF
jgi:thiol-disulfide isomerase/thioredoxin